MTGFDREQAAERDAHAGIGALGFTGRHLARRLLASGRRVTARPPERALSDRVAVLFNA